MSIVTESEETGLKPTSITVPKTLHKLEDVISGKAVKPITTGIEDLDRIVQILPSKLIIICGKSQHGKSVLANQIGFYNALYFDKKVAVFNMEMDDTEIIGRGLSYLAQIDNYKFNRLREMTEAEHLKVIDKADILSHHNFYIDDSGYQTISSIKAKMMKLRQICGLDLVVIDYLQLIKNTTHIKRNEQVAEIARDLKLLSKEFHVPIIAISSLIKDVQGKPKLSDLKESGDIEYSADIIIAPYLDYKDNLEIDSGVASYRVLKNRGGITGEHNIRFNGAYSYFEDWR